MITVRMYFPTCGAIFVESNSPPSHIIVQTGVCGVKCDWLSETLHVVQILTYFQNTLKSRNFYMIGSNIV